jgi:hypothetical protein
MRSIETEGAVAERRREGCAFAHAFGAPCGERVEIVEIVRQLREAFQELVQALRVADVGFVLQGHVDVSLAQYLAGAIVDCPAVLHHHYPPFSHRLRTCPPRRRGSSGWAWCWISCADALSFVGLVPGLRRERVNRVHASSLKLTSTRPPSTPRPSGKACFTALVTASAVKRASGTATSASIVVGVDARSRS